MKIEELKKVIESAKNNPDFDMNNWGECLVGSYLKYYEEDEDEWFFEAWNDSYSHDERYCAAAKYFDIKPDDAWDLFGMREDYTDIYTEHISPDNGTPKDIRLRVRNLAIDRLEEFIWEAENG